MKNQDPFGTVLPLGARNNRKQEKKVKRKKIGVKKKKVKKIKREKKG